MSSGDPQASDVQPEPTPSVGENLTPSELTDKGTAETPQNHPTAAEPTRAEPVAQLTAAEEVVNRPAARGLGVAKPASPAAGPLAGKVRELTQKGQESDGESKPKGDSSNAKHPGGTGKPMGPTLGPFRPGKPKPGQKPGQGGAARAAGGDAPVSAVEAEAQEDRNEQTSTDNKQSQGGYRPKVSVPNLRQPLTDDLQAELDVQLAAADVASILSGPAGMETRKELEEGEKVRGKVLKMDAESVYVSLGGPYEGAVSRLQFTEETLPEVGQPLEVIVRGFNNADGLYNLVVPGQALDVSDWEDLDEGTIVEAHVAAANTGGLEATVGNIRGFIPISQIAQYRVEDASEFVGQRLMCLVTECNPRRKNLVLSHRAVLEREREEQRQQQLEKIEAGDVLEGTVRSVKDFGVFVDLGGLDGLIHVTKLSWDHVKTPGDVLEVGQKVKVKIDKVDKQTGKIGLSYRDLMENPWDSVDANLPVGSVVSGTVSRLANFGAFVRLSAGIEGLVHISEVAGHRVSNVNSVLKEGEEVAVKILSIERESQRIALSIKQAQSKAAESTSKAEEEVDEPPRELAVKRQHAGPLKGGTGSESSGNPFGLNL